MEKTADWVSRRAGFGFSLSEDPISEKQWFDNARSSITNYKRYTSKTRIKQVIGSIKRGLTDEQRKTYSGITLGKNAGIVHRKHLWKEEQRLLQSNEDMNKLWVEKTVRPMWLCALRRADFCINTKDDFANRLWLFWLNYFTVSESMNNMPCLPNFHEMLRVQMFGSMSDLVFKAITHPAMILYLDNNQNTGENSRARKEKWTTDGINENLARETLELYTVTPGNGYTQDDVNGMTNILTGWKVVDWDQFAEVKFDQNYHKPGSQKVLGKKYNQTTGKGQLKRVIRDLTSMQDTANHIAFRLCRHFISDSPEPKHVKRLADIYMRKKGKLAPVYLELLDILASIDRHKGKFLNPEIWLYQCMKTFDIAPPSFPSGGWSYSSGFIDRVLSELGLLHGMAQQPNGWPDVEDDWLSNEYLDRRLRFSALIGRLRSYKSAQTERIKANGFTKEDLIRFGLSKNSVNVITGSEKMIDQIVPLVCSPGFLRS